MGKRFYEPPKMVDYRFCHKPVVIFITAVLCAVINCSGGVAGSGSMRFSLCG